MARGAGRPLADRLEAVSRMTEEGARGRQIGRVLEIRPVEALDRIQSDTARGPGVS
jgi:hypothetical protein